MAISTPDNEPYLGRTSVHQFDNLLTLFIEEQTRIGTWTRSATTELTPLQRAASELVPSTSSIVLSIRELVRQGYLLSALILTRPLMERVVTLSYLIENPSKVVLWEQGWPHKSRPPLAERIRAMTDVKESDPSLSTSPAETEVAEILDRYNGLVHGDRSGALHGAILLPDGRPGFTIGKDLNSPARADEVCFETVSWLVVLLARCSQLFPPPATSRG